MSTLPNEYTEVELPLLRQLVDMGWSHIEGSKWEPSASDRETFREVVLSSHLRALLRRINVDDGTSGIGAASVTRTQAD
jgi:type I restriction enzyme R subunit